MSPRRHLAGMSTSHPVHALCINFLLKTLHMVATLLQVLASFCKLADDNRKERTFIMVKPDGVQRGIVGEVVKRFEQRGYKLVACKLCRPTLEQVKMHYEALSSKPFYPGLVEYMSSGPVVAMAWEGKEVVKMGRAMLGATIPLHSHAGTIRGDHCIDVGRNVCHGSDCIASAKKEINLWFTSEEIMDFTSCQFSWIYE